jgi:hypothetical protein
VAFSAEAAAYVGEGTVDLFPAHTHFVIENATLRLLEGDKKCAPRLPKEVRVRLRCLARKWLTSNPVTEFLDAVSGPRVDRVVRWEDPNVLQPDDATTGDRVTLLLDRRRDRAGDSGTDCCDDDLDGLAVMFCPHQPAPVVRTVDDGLQVLVPERARTGPVAVVRTSHDFAPVRALISDYARCFPLEWSLSIFGYVRMDMWAFPYAFGHPIIEISAGPETGRPNQDDANPGPQPAVAER